METNRIPKQLRDLIVKSRNLVAEINQKSLSEHKAELFKKYKNNKPK